VVGFFGAEVGGVGGAEAVFEGVGGDAVFAGGSAGASGAEGVEAVGGEAFFGDGFAGRRGERG
jgi:hypothetical protein